MCLIKASFLLLRSKADSTSKEREGKEKLKGLHFPNWGFANVAEKPFYSFSFSFPLIWMFFFSSPKQTLEVQTLSCLSNFFPSLLFLFMFCGFCTWESFLHSYVDKFFYACLRHIKNEWEKLSKMKREKFVRCYFSLQCAVILGVLKLNTKVAIPL